MAHTRLRANRCAKVRTHGCQQNGIVAVRLLWFNRQRQLKNTDQKTHNIQFA